MDEQVNWKKKIDTNTFCSGHITTCNNPDTYKTKAGLGIYESNQQTKIKLKWMIGTLSSLLHTYMHISWN